MKIQFLCFFLSLSFVLAWRVDRRCLEEGQLLVGDELDGLVLENGNGEDLFPLGDENFNWEDLENLGLEEEDSMNLRGSSRSQNTSSFSNTTRNLQSGRTFNLKLYWKRGACWQGARQNQLKIRSQ